MLATNEADAPRSGRIEAISRLVPYIHRSKPTQGRGGRQRHGGGGRDVKWPVRRHLPLEHPLEMATAPFLVQDDPSLLRGA